MKVSRNLHYDNRVSTPVSERPTPRIDFIFFDAGGGHRAAANALKSVIEKQGRPWDVRMVNLQEYLDPLDVFRKVTGLRLQDLYNLMLKKGWTLGSGWLAAGMHAVIRLYHRPTVRLLEKLWHEERPDMVVSIVPNFNRAMRESLARVLPSIPYVTILTDIADYPPHFWLERQEQYVVCGSDRAVEQAREHGIPPDRIFRASGMILRPVFYEPLEVDRAAERVKLGLDAQKPTGLVLFGGEGSTVMSDIVQRLDTSGLDVQLILICGRNQKLADALRAMRTRIPIHVEDFTERVPWFMKLSDFFIGKPGPGSISEALHMGLPVIVDRNAWTLPQERYNAEWIREHDVGLVVSNFRQVADAVRELLQPAALGRMQANAARLDNRAIFEIPDRLEKILCRHSSSQS